MAPFVSRLSKVAGLTLVLALAGASIGGLWSPSASADDVYTIIVKKQEEKAKSRWSLSDWLETRDKMRLMDLWLALHSPSPYEFFLSGAYVPLRAADDTRDNGWNFGFAAYASIFGLEYEHEEGFGTRNAGLFNLRVFGYQVQATNITIQAGLKHEKDRVGGNVKNIVLGPSVTLYLARYFGITGYYRHLFPLQATPGDPEMKANNYLAGAFIDFKYLRIFGNYRYEARTYLVAGAEQETSVTALEAGARFFF